MIDALKAAGASNVSANVTMKIVAHVVQRGLKVMSNVKNIIAVASGKGGVGKRTVAVNLALALAAEGAKVGLLDADIYGPSKPTMLGIRAAARRAPTASTIVPMENHGVKVMSIGFLIDADQPMVWRGPMVAQALQQFLDEADWGDLDYLVIDMPPGTGDIQLTLVAEGAGRRRGHRHDAAGHGAASTRQGHQDVREGRACRSSASSRTWPCTSARSAATPSTSSATAAASASPSSTGSNCWARAARHPHPRTADSGRPTVVSEPDSRDHEHLQGNRAKVAVRIADKARDMSLKMPTIKVTNT